MTTSVADERVGSVRTTDDELVVAFADGRTLSVPLAWYPRLLNASAEQRSDWRLIGEGEGIHWSQIDEDLSAEGLLRGIAAPGSRLQPSPMENIQGVIAAAGMGGEQEGPTQGTAQALHAMSEQATTVMQGNMQLAQEVFQSSMQQLQQQTQAMQQMTQTLSEQAQSQQPAIQTLVQESANTYSDFLNSAMSFYRQGMQAWSQVAQQSMQAAGQATQQSMNAANQAAQQSAQAASQAAQQ